MRNKTKLVVRFLLTGIFIFALVWTVANIITVNYSSLILDKTIHETSKVAKFELSEFDGAAHYLGPPTYAVVVPFSIEYPRTVNSGQVFPVKFSINFDEARFSIVSAIRKDRNAPKSTPKIDITEARTELRKMISEKSLSFSLDIASTDIKPEKNTTLSPAGQVAWSVQYKGSQSPVVGYIKPGSYSFNKSISKYSSSSGLPFLSYSLDIDDIDDLKIQFDVAPPLLSVKNEPLSILDIMSILTTLSLATIFLVRLGRSLMIKKNNERKSRIIVRGRD